MTHHLDLSGTWKIRWTDGQRGKASASGAEREETDLRKYIDATVPGEVHLDLLAAGLIDDPYIETNVLKARWVEEMIWSYRKVFDAPADALRAGTRAWLAFEGLDLVARIVLNGQEVGRHNNSFYPCRVDVTGKLKASGNVLAVHLDPGLFWVADRNNGDYEHSPDSRLHKRHWLRKPQSQFNWDWSPRMVNVGIFKPVRLEWSVDAVRVDQMAPLAEVTPDGSRGTVRTRLVVEGLRGEPVKGKLTVELEGTGQRVTSDVEIKPGVGRVEATVSIDNPRLWWPVGPGAQERYTVRATLSVDGKPVGEQAARIGFRHVCVIQDPHRDGGRYFIIEINGKRIFCKGGNFVPADLIPARLDRKRYESLVDLALEANFNFLRVWGGGLYESDDFYDLCDERGILVWQDFIFACSKYPVDDVAWYEDVQREARWNVRRLAKHPSLVVWCGNNELEMGAWQWGYDRRGKVLPDYALYHMALPRIMKEEDPTRYYQPSSPWSPDNETPNADHLGDQHPWSLGFWDNDFRKYRSFVCRFPNEGGSLGPTSLPTMLACLPGDQMSIESFAWQIHDNSVSTWFEPSSIDQIMEFWLGRDIRTMTVEDFTYWGGLVHGEALREYCETFRRKMWDCAAAIIWMYNDVWPATRSWTIVDYYLRRTPAFHPVRRALAPVSVALAEAGDDVIVQGINEGDEPITAQLRFGLFNLSGGMPIDQTTEATLAPNASTVIARFKRSEWTDPTSQVAFAMLTQGDTLIARNRLILPTFKELKWGPADVRVSVRDGRATFESGSFIWGVCIDLAGEVPLPDNFFDVWPGIPYSIPWTAGEPPTIVRTGNLNQ